MTSAQNACACYVVLDRELQVVHQEVGMMLTSAINYLLSLIVFSPSITTAISGLLSNTCRCAPAHSSCLTISTYGHVALYTRVIIIYTRYTWYYIHVETVS